MSAWQETGEWNGLVKAVKDHQADLCMTSLKSTPDRNTQIDFSVPFLETGLSIIVAVKDGALTPTAFLSKPPSRPPPFTESHPHAHRVSQ